MDQTELLQKALETADLMAGGGELNPEQSEKFITYLQDLSLMTKDAQIFGITGVNLVPRMPEYVRRLAPLLKEGRLRIHVDRAFPLAEADKAHELMRSGNFLGKIALVP